eukprot:COSAG05_NODE_17_length_35518_cov_34.728084_22_plen_65_part_00
MTADADPGANRSPSQPGHDSPFKVRIHPLDKGPAVVTRLYRTKVYNVLLNPLLSSYTQGGILTK